MEWFIRELPLYFEASMDWINLPIPPILGCLDVCLIQGTIMYDYCLTLIPPSRWQRTFFFRSHAAQKWKKKHQKRWVGQFFHLLYKVLVSFTLKSPAAFPIDRNLRLKNILKISFNDGIRVKPKLRQIDRRM